ncbi:MAG: hypothetical protein L0H79_18880 [Intrasporangium sp.]|uniref:hypothetical protein n=1 Tax=Intrasporangium sp. TaxID=1925024 RepID=UPI00264A0AB9|nr:hypothetical protein [Intrasporangium sp.]MDN5797792.1 hypothetical protein [Intrasporangium sp.]
MVLSGLILMALGIVVGAVAAVGAYGATGPVHVEAFGLQRDASALELVIGGGIAVLLFCLGWAALTSRVRHRTRLRREQREEERLADVERASAAERTEHERRMEEAGLRDEDLRRRESELAARDKEADDRLGARQDELAARQEQLEAREGELARREAQWRQQVGPSVADVVTGRAKGAVSEGTAEWVDDGTAGPDPDPDAHH